MFRADKQQILSLLQKTTLILLFLYTQFRQLRPPSPDPRPHPCLPRGKIFTSPINGNSESRWQSTNPDRSKSSHQNSTCTWVGNRILEGVSSNDYELTNHEPAHEELLV